MFAIFECFTAFHLMMMQLILEKKVLIRKEIGKRRKNQNKKMSKKGNYNKMEKQQSFLKVICFDIFIPHIYERKKHQKSFRQKRLNLHKMLQKLKIPKKSQTKVSIIYSFTFFNFLIKLSIVFMNLLSFSNKKFLI